MDGMKKSTYILLFFIYLKGLKFDVRSFCNPSEYTIKGLFIALLVDQKE